MKIGILGSGNMGRSLGMRWAEAGHQVFFGGRSPDKAREVAAFVGQGSQGGSLDDAGAFGEILLHTARDVLLSDLLSDLATIAGKVVIDLNNRPIYEGLEFEPVTESYTEELQRDAPDARLVKAFNMFAQELFEHDASTIASYGVSLFMAGDDPAAKADVGRLGADLGFTPIDVGPLRNSRLVETMGDAIRYLIIGSGLGGFATLSVRALPKADASRLGGRQTSALAGQASRKSH